MITHRYRVKAVIEEERTGHIILDTRRIGGTSEDPVEAMKKEVPQIDPADYIEPRDPGEAFVHQIHKGLRQAGFIIAPSPRPYKSSDEEGIFLLQLTVREWEEMGKPNVKDIVVRMIGREPNYVSL